jgi:hypothetical protein
VGSNTLTAWSFSSGGVVASVWGIRYTLSGDSQASNVSCRRGEISTLAF